MEYRRDEHRVHLVVYHLIWCPKRRKPVLVSNVANNCEQLLRQKYEQKGWDILQLAIQPDHIHIFVRVFPKKYLGSGPVVGEMAPPTGIKYYHNACVALSKELLKEAVRF